MSTLVPSVVAIQDGQLRRRYRGTDFISFFGTGQIMGSNCGSRIRTMSRNRFYGAWYHRRVHLPLRDLQAKGMSLESSYIQIKLSRGPDSESPKGAPWYSTKYNDM